MSEMIQLKVCLGSSCYPKGNKDIIPYIKEYMRDNNISDKITISEERCINNCLQRPNIKINDKIISGISKENINSVLDKNLTDLL